MSNTEKSKDDITSEDKIVEIEVIEIDDIDLSDDDDQDFKDIDNETEDTVTIFGVVMDGKTSRPKDRIDVSKIVDRLYLGSFKNAAKCKEGLEHYGITHVLTVGFQMEEPFPKDFNYHVIQIDDSPDAEISKYFEECFEFISNALKNPQNRVLIHCWAGVSRSATITISYLMKNFIMSYPEACEHVRKARHWIDPNRGFRQQLRILGLRIGFTNEEDDFKYERVAKALKRMYKQGFILRKHYDRVLKVFNLVFGLYHQHTIDIAIEMKPFIKDE